MVRLAALEGPMGRRPQGRGFFAGLSWIAGSLATVAAVVLAAVLTLVFAATMAVILVLAAGFVGAWMLAHRARRAHQAQGALIEARKVGHSWVAYGLDRRRG